MEPNGRPPPQRTKVHPVVMAAIVVLVAVISVVVEVRERREREERRQELDRMVEQLEDCFADEECFSRLRERLRLTRPRRAAPGLSERSRSWDR